jgi:hypothetical protein
MPVIAAAGVAAASLLLYQHWTHVVSYLPWLLVLLCPLMHLFMHRGHGHRMRDRDATGDAARSARDGGEAIRGRTGARTGE